MKDLIESLKNSTHPRPRELAREGEALLYLIESWELKAKEISTHIQEQWIDINTPEIQEAMKRAIADSAEKNGLIAKILTDPQYRGIEYVMAAYIMKHGRIPVTQQEANQMWEEYDYTRIKNRLVAILDAFSAETGTSLTIHEEGTCAVLMRDGVKSLTIKTPYLSLSYHGMTSELLHTIEPPDMERVELTPVSKPPKYRRLYTCLTCRPKKVAE